MAKIIDKMRGLLIKFLGINSFCTLSEEAYVSRLAASLLKAPRIFGDPSRLLVEERVVLNDTLINLSSGSVIIRKNAFMGHGVSLLTGTHDQHQFGLDRQAAVPQEGRDIIIEEGVWIASGALVIGPCTIGSHSVVAAGSVVVSDVPPYSVYAGIPAKKIAAI